MIPVEVAPGDSPVILGLPHTGTWLPDDIRARLNARGQVLADTDWHIERLYDGLLPGATTVRATFHRYVIDANRGADDASLYPGQNTTGLVPLTDFDGEAIWLTEPDAADIAHRKAQFHAPYHAALAAEVARVRARHGVALIVTGGIAPAPSGVTMAGGAVLNDASHLAHHRHITDAVHQEGGKIALQILHTGRYSYQPALVAPSALQAPINRFTPHELSHDEILTLIDDFAHCAQLAREAGYDGVEVMGSEGYLINEFLAARTNQRDDQWGGDYARRMRFAVEVVKAVRQRAGHDFIIIYRLSMLDLVNDGSTLAEVTELAKAIEAAGATIINTGIGWHEARIPTIATPVPRGAFSWVTRKLKGAVSIPLITTNRINDPQVAEDILARGDADMVSMARPFLADAEFISKAQDDRADQINTCIGCNQACLDRIFVGKVTSCLVNPRACHETLMPVLPANAPKRLAVVGAGPAEIFQLVEAERRTRRGVEREGAALLDEAPGAPAALFVVGDATALWQPQVAIVGSRSPTSGGRDNAHYFARAFASAGIVVVSGMARGIDAAAHEAALAAGSGTTVVTRSRNSLPALKCGTYFSETCTFSPDLGLRPTRGGR